MATTAQTPHELVPAEAFVRTYSHPSYADPWEAVRDYAAVMDLQADQPDLGSTAVSGRLDLPRSRVREWLDGAQPHCLRGLELAEEHGWVDVDAQSETFRGLNVLLAWVYSGGSIARDSYRPNWVVEDATDREILDAAGDRAGIEVDITRSATADRAREVKPVRAASILGRVLVVLGAPRGEKNASSNVTLPGYLQHTSRQVREEFVQVYLHNRAQARPGRSDMIQFREDRTAGYLQSLAKLIRQLTGEKVTVSEKNVLVSAAAAREIAVWDPLLGIE